MRFGLTGFRDVEIAVVVGVDPDRVRHGERQHRAVGPADDRVEGLVSLDEHAAQVVDEVRAHFGPKVCKQVIPRSVRLSEAPSFGQPIIMFDARSRGALAYRELAKEVSGGEADGTR